MKARTYLILMALAILLPVALLVAAGLGHLLEWERASRLRGVAEAARSTALAIDRDIAAAEASLRAIAHSQALRDGRLDQVHRDASAANGATNGATPWSWTLVSDYGGAPVMNTLVPWGTPLPAYTGRWAADVYESRRTRVSGYFVGLLARRPTISVDVPTPRDGGPRYVVSQVIDASHFMQVFDGGALSPGWLVTVFDANGISIARNRNPDQRVGRPVDPALYRASRAQPSGMFRHVTLDGVDVYSSYTRAPLSQWTVAVGVPVAEVEAAARTAASYAALAMLALLGMAVGIAVLLGQRLSVSLERARAAVEDLARGPLRRPRTTRVREVDMLLDALHRTSDGLAHEQAARHGLELEREALLRSEREARQAAEAQSRAKDAFLAMLGHELRNPLAAIEGALAVLDLAAVKPAQAAQARAIGRRQARHLARIVDDLLDVHRILSGKVHLRPVRLDAAAVLRHCCESRMVADAGAHAWRIDVQASPLWIDADPTRLGQVFDNLLHNAIKYTPAGGAIEVRAAAADSRAVIEVADTGVGIDPDTLPFIFEALVQGPTSIDRAQGGLGLGLALVRELTALHGGTVRAGSEGPGRGCVFTLTLPLALPAADEDASAAHGA